MSHYLASFGDFVGNHWEILDLIFVAVGLTVYVVASHTLHQRRHPSAAIAWVLGILFLPYLVLPLYLAFGSRKLVAPRTPDNRQRVVGEILQPQATAARTLQLAQAMGLPAPVGYENLVIHENGSQALSELRRVIRAAKRTLDISTFILGRDVLGDEVVESLKQRAMDGVRVRLLIDGVGFYLSGLPDLKALMAAGVEVVRFVPPFRSPRRGRTNLRNHRKMVIADGGLLWCGGRNLSAEYFEGDPRPLIGRPAWLDLSFCVEGSIVQQARDQFEWDWAFALERPVPGVLLNQHAVVGAPIETERKAQLVDSGPDRADDTVFTLLVSACFTSQKRILAVTPYFVPDPALLTALALSARRGISIDLVLPARSNHRLADFARHRALRDLVAAGGRVWLHPQMIHAKAVLVDDELALVGSANLDGRSLFLNYEMMVAFYDISAVQRFSCWVDARRREAVPYEASVPGFWREISEGLILWLAFQL